MKKLILVIDDDRVFKQLLVEQIADMGLAAIGAASWAEASAILVEREPDLIFLDFKLPDADTPQLVETLSPQFPVIVLTGFGSIRNAVSLIVESGTRTKEDLLAVEFTMHPGDIENLTGLPPGWFNRQEASVVQLSLKQDAAKPHSDAPAGEVVPFARR